MNEHVKRLYSIKEAAKYFDRSDWSIRHMIWSGVIPYVKIAGRIHLDIKDMEACIEQHKIREEA